MCIEIFSLELKVPYISSHIVHKILIVPTMKDDYNVY